jgi:MoaA/NifB/PqqE/SkfB family radical SAM enzyme
MYKYEDIKVVHLEITEKCQAGCIMCGRHEGPDNTLLQHLTNAELSLDDCKSIFPSDFVSRLKTMYMCGNYGDPIIAKDTLEVFEYFRYCNPRMDLKMFTNGGARNADWWRDLASLLYRGRVTFAIDGLEDTNHIYRENVQWSKIMAAAEAFIGAGGEAEWCFIVFKHNEHQVEEASELARKMGFKKFTPKRTARFPDRKTTYKHLTQTERKGFVHEINEFKRKKEKEYGSYSNFLDKTEISCKVAKDRAIYVTAEGLLLPCCWLGGSAIYDGEMSSYRDGELFKKIIEDKIDIDTKVHGIKGVFDSGLFEKIEESWSIPSLREGKLRTCSKVCSVTHDHFEDQFVRS